VFHRWYGHPLHRWPEILLLYYGWTQNMAKALLARGFDPEYFKPKLPGQVKAGRSPRTAAQAPRFEGASLPSITLRWCDVCRRNTPRVDGAPCAH
jgi:hypothetical protein